MTNIQKHSPIYNGIEFYHTFYFDKNKRTIDLWDFQEDGNDTLIYGHWNHNKLIGDIKSSLNFTNKTVLDVACRDGFYSYVAEQQKNTVTGVDFDNREARKFTHEFLNSKVEFIHDNIHAMYKWDRKFDILIVGDVLVHLENPFGVLKMLRNLTKERIIIISDYYESDAPTITVLPHLECSYIFSISSLKLLMEMSGFKNITPLKKMVLTSSYVYNDRPICVISADINPDYKFDKCFSSYFPVIL